MTYVKCDDAMIDRQVDAAIHTALASTQSGETILKIGFHVRRDRKGWLSIVGGGSAEQEWEQWLLKVDIRQFSSDEEQRKFRRALEHNLHSCLIYVATMSAEYRDHVPGARYDGLENASMLPVHPMYRISVPNSQGAESWSGIFKKIISDTASLSYT